MSLGYRTKLQSKTEANNGGFVDTHCHLDMILPRLRQEYMQDVRKAKESGEPLPARLGQGFEGWRSSLQGPEGGFEGCVNIGCSADTLDAAAAFLLCDGVYGAFGIHPLAAEDWSEHIEQKIWNFMALPKVVAWGECGLDYFDKNTRGQIQSAEKIALQRHVFTKQLQLASSLGKPLVVHTRMAEEDTLELMKAHLPASHPVHVHCFTSSLGMAEALLSNFPRLYLGFTGVVTFTNARDVQEVVRNTPIDRILLETDGPYMAPEPCRGRVAHPGHVIHVAERIAKIKRLPTEDVLTACRQNTRLLYGV